MLFMQVWCALGRSSGRPEGHTCQTLVATVGYPCPVRAQNMKKRLTGELEVSTSVRYADVPSAPKKSGGRAGAVRCAPRSCARSLAQEKRQVLAPTLPVATFVQLTLASGGLDLGH